jgi:hypothetical protein
MRLNSRQQVAALAGMMVVVLVGLFPPWLYQRRTTISEFLGHKFIFATVVATSQNPRERDKYDDSFYKSRLSRPEERSRVHLTMWLVEIAIVLVVTGGVVLAFDGQPSKRST